MQYAFDKVVNLFTHDADVIRTKNAYLACKVFDILYLRTEPSITDLELMIDDIAFFQFPEFTVEFLQQMKDELPNLLRLVSTNDFDFDARDVGGKKYNDRVITRARRARKRAIVLEVAMQAHENEFNHGDNVIPINIEEKIAHVDNVMNLLNDTDFRVMEWKNDPGERSRRLYAWWRSIMNGHNTQLPTFATVVRLIVTL